MTNQTNGWKKKSTWEAANALMPNKWVLPGAVALFALSAVAGILLGQFFIPLGCLILLAGGLMMLMKLDMDNSMLFLVTRVAFAALIILGAVLLYKGLSSGVNRQDDLQYTESLGITAEELLAVTGSEGDKYAAVVDGAISRRLIPVQYRAEKAEEIGAVLIVTTSYNKTGSYTNGGTAYKGYVTINLKSLKTGEVIDTTTLSGDEPPQSVRTSPLDPNKDRYGKMPSDDRISSACASLIEGALKEAERKNRVTLLSEEELREFVRNAVDRTAGDDGWSREYSVENALKEDNPDFTFKDYGFKDLLDYCKNDSRFAVKEREFTTDAMALFTSSDYVRWAGE